MSLHPFCCTVRDTGPGHDLFDVEVAVSVERVGHNLWNRHRYRDRRALGERHLSRWQWMWGGTTMTKHICDNIQQQAQGSNSTGNPARLWEMVRGRSAHGSG